MGFSENISLDVRRTLSAVALPFIPISLTLVPPHIASPKSPVVSSAVPSPSFHNSCAVSSPNSPAYLPRIRIAKEPPHKTRPATEYTTPSRETRPKRAGPVPGMTWEIWIQKRRTLSLTGPTTGPTRACWPWKELRLRCQKKQIKPIRPVHLPRREAERYGMTLLSTRRTWRAGQV